MKLSIIFIVCSNRKYNCVMLSGEGKENGEKTTIGLTLFVQYVVLGPRKCPMPLVRVFSENDKIFRLEKKYVV